MQRMLPQFATSRSATRATETQRRSRPGPIVGTRVSDPIGTPHKNGWERDGRTGLLLGIGHAQPMLRAVLDARLQLGLLNDPAEVVGIAGSNGIVPLPAVLAEVELRVEGGLG